MEGGFLGAFAGTAVRVGATAATAAGRAAALATAAAARAAAATARAAASKAAAAARATAARAAAAARAAPANALAGLRAAPGYIYRNPINAALTGVGIGATVYDIESTRMRNEQNAAADAAAAAEKAKFDAEQLLIDADNARKTQEADAETTRLNTEAQAAIDRQNAATAALEAEIARQNEEFNRLIAIQSGAATQSGTATQPGAAPEQSILDILNGTTTPTTSAPVYVPPTTSAPVYVPPTTSAPVYVPPPTTAPPTTKPGRGRRRGGAKNEAAILKMLSGGCWAAPPDPVPPRYIEDERETPVPPPRQPIYVAPPPPPPPGRRRVGRVVRRPIISRRGGSSYITTDRYTGIRTLYPDTRLNPNATPRVLSGWDPRRVVSFPGREDEMNRKEQERYEQQMGQRLLDMRAVAAAARAAEERQRAEAEAAAARMASMQLPPRYVTEPTEAEMIVEKIDYKQPEPIIEYARGYSSRGRLYPDDHYDSSGRYVGPPRKLDDVIIDRAPADTLFVPGGISDRAPTVTAAAVAAARRNRGITTRPGPITDRFTPLPAPYKPPPPTAKERAQNFLNRRRGGAKGEKAILKLLNAM